MNCEWHAVRNFTTITHPESLMGTILLIVLILILLGATPVFPHSRQWGYRPASLVSLILIIVIVMVLLGYVPIGF
jgi:hypothetical protein